MMETESPVKPLPVPESRWKRVLYVLVVTVLPVICFSIIPEWLPEWQSGALADYAKLMISSQVAFFFFPLIFYSVVCFDLVLIAPRRFGNYFMFRLGIYTGTVVAFQFALIFLKTEYAMVSVTTAGILILVSWILGKTRTKFGSRGQTILAAVICLLVTIFFFVLLGLIPDSDAENILFEWVGYRYMGLLFGTLSILTASPILCCTIMAITSYKLLRHYEKGVSMPVWRGVGLLAWFAAYAFAWRFSVLKTLEIYHSLPTSPPHSDCYIATASARGHRRIVHSELVTTENGVIWVTKQLRVLKCAELALMALAPRLHRWLRVVYDVIGHAFARRLTNPLLADLAYLMLKPFEWAARLVLKAIVPEIDEYASRLYGARQYM
jgi:hypothetical protein